MKIRFNILSPNNTGNPDYDICGQGSSQIDSDTLAVKLTLNGIVVFDEPDCSGTITTIPVLPFVAGNRTLNQLVCNGSDFIIELADIISPDTFALLKVEISKGGYQPYSNTFNLFDYDLGNYNLIGGTNPDFDFYLVANANNLDINGIQTKAFSKFIAYRRPFTDNIYYYNAVGTQGTISYSNTSSTPIFLSLGQNGTVCAETGMKITQTITVEDIYSNTLDICTSDLTKAYLNWLPILNTNVDCSPACDDDCVSNIGTGNVITTVDLTSLACVNVDDVAIYPYHNSPNVTIAYYFYDYQGQLIQIIPANISIGACGTVCPESPVQIPIPTLPDLGDVVVVVDFLYLSDSLSVENYYVKCSKNLTIKRCNWLTITETENCGEFKVTNCSVDETTLTIKQLQEDKTLLEISSVVISPLNNTTVILLEDGVYSFEVPSKVEGETDIFIVINSCNFNACLLTKLNSLMCNTHEESCIASIKQYYDFNAFVLNAHAYFSLLNEEYNFNYIYKSLDVDKLNNLFTIKQYLDNIASYCEVPCSTCNCGK